MLLEVANQLLSLIPIIQSLQKEQKELADCALREINNAIVETRFYLHTLENDSPRNIEKEQSLVRLWSSAAIPMRHLNKELALLCDHKAKYWLNPSQWSESELIEHGLKLDQVADAYRQLLGK
ncbi:hypothetical protein [Pseudoalteromonas sp. Of7M-16]|uniref:hypothetical protein n=1 Tax=Pseudoalteromonas sp. Of7M-16 TaxID=2917756 RepID=UPI001EF4CFCD|nr:hypothetical protein [Pseudoalteromonas sp. Of7M-16]MCG7549215.1 hypothetical protein [Pseudoalteromonas sp. Of7M-16]